jgi:hydrogenase maturation protease
MRTAVFCVGNKLMLDEGLGPAVYEELMRAYDLPDTVDLYDVGCMGLDMLPKVRDYDCLITVDAVDGTGEQPGTVLRFKPEDMARHSTAMQSLHDLKLADIFDAAALLGYEAQGICLGMQVENMAPTELVIGLTPPVYEALPRLVEALLAELVAQGARIYAKESGEEVAPGWKHRCPPG